MSIYDFRLHNTRALADDFDTLVEFADLCGMRPTHMSRLISKSGERSRNIGSKAARKIEKACGKPPSWLDISHSAVTASDISDEEIAIQFSLLFRETSGLTEKFCSGTMSREQIMKSLIVLIEAIQSVK